MNVINYISNKYLDSLCMQCRIKLSTNALFLTMLPGALEDFAFFIIVKALWCWPHILVAAKEELQHLLRPWGTFHCPKGTLRWVICALGMLLSIGSNVGIILYFHSIPLTKLSPPRQIAEVHSLNLLPLALHWKIQILFVLRYESWILEKSEAIQQILARPQFTKGEVIQVLNGHQLSFQKTEVIQLSCLKGWVFHKSCVRCADDVQILKISSDIRRWYPPVMFPEFLLKIPNWAGNWGTASCHPLRAN